MKAIRRVIVGTAGHIDHGKSSLVRALTGVDPDRLEEERRRGMTIDLGFAPYEHASGALVGVIDVPGHERFVRNMVAGATSVDIVLLVVAADDGVMPQTREHLAILSLLGVERGLVVLSKADLVDADLLELARADIAALLAGTFLQDAPILPVASPSGAGIPELRAALDALIAGVPERDEAGPFRLPIQRVFTLEGHGTVVTGVPVGGQVAVGDELEIVGRDGLLRVRGVQAYGGARESGRAGHSTALNLTGAAREDVRRGDVVATPGVFLARRRVTVHYRHVHEEALRPRLAVRLHTGTSETLGVAVPLDAASVAQGDESFVQLRLDEPVVVAPGDRYLLRHASSLAVLGGGQVLATTEGRLKRFKERVLADVRARHEASGDVARLACAALAQAGVRGLSAAEVAAEAGLPVATARARLAELQAVGELLASGERWFDAGVADEVAEALLRSLGAEHRRRPLHEWVELAALRRELDAPDELVAAVLGRDERFELAAGGRLRKRGWRVQLNEAQAGARVRVREALKTAGATPPAPDAALTGLPEPASAALLAAMRAAGELVSVGGLLYDAEVLRELRGRILEHGRARGGAIDIPVLRDDLGTTRKYLIPLLEHFDSEGLTVRHGERRTLRHVEGGA